MPSNRAEPALGAPSGTRRPFPRTEDAWGWPWGERALAHPEGAGQTQVLLLRQGGHVAPPPVRPALTPCKTPCDLGAPTWKEGARFGLADGSGCWRTSPGGEVGAA